MLTKNSNDERLAVRAARCHSYRLGAVLTLWMLMSGLGLGVLIRYSRVPGAPAGAPRSWPQESAMQRKPNQASLVMFIHPYCACSRASLSNLARLLAHSGRGLSVQVDVVCSSQESAPDRHSDNVLAAANIPGVSVQFDPDGVEARIFQASVSGDTVLYDRAGKLRFHGGITPFRGHEGDCAGQAAILTFEENPKSVDADPAAPVFGCSLL